VGMPEGSGGFDACGHQKVVRKAIKGDARRELDGRIAGWLEVVWRQSVSHKGGLPRQLLHGLLEEGRGLGREIATAEER